MTQGRQVRHASVIDVKVAGEEYRVPITPFLGGKIFDPEIITTMSSVFVLICDRLGLAGKEDQATWLVAEKVVELASAGHDDEESLRAKALHAFGLSD